MFLSCSSELAPPHLATSILRELRRRFCGTFLIDHLQWCVPFTLLFLLLCDSYKSTLAASVSTAAIGCGIPEECSSEQLFEDCHKRGTTESLLCYCSNGMPRTCREVCDSSEAFDTCPSQCQDYLSCKAHINLAADEGWNVGWYFLVAIVVFCVSAVVVAVVFCVRLRRNIHALPCCSRIQPADELELGTSRRAATGASVQEELAHGTQETRPPDMPVLNPEVRSSLPPGHESASLLENS